MKIVRLTPELWRDFSAAAQKIAFGEVHDPSTDRIDYALLAIHDDKPAAYVTCRETTSDAVYYQYGGSMPWAKGGIVGHRAVMALIDHARGKYKRVTMLILNTNRAMLKTALKAGFVITGVRVYKGSILVEHLLEFEGT